MAVLTRFAYASPGIVALMLIGPMLVLTVGLLMSAGRGFPTTDDGRLAFDLATGLSYAVQVAWIWSVFEIASERAERRRSVAIRFLFVGLLLAGSAFLAWSAVAPTEAYLFLFGQQRNGLQTALGVISACALFVGAWIAASTLVAADVPGPRPYRRLDTFLLMIALPIGAWFLHRRVTALRAA